MISTIGETERRKLSTTLDLLGRYAVDEGLRNYDADDPRITAAIEYVFVLAADGFDMETAQSFLDEIRQQKVRGVGKPYNIPRFGVLIRTTIEEGYRRAEVVEANPKPELIEPQAQRAVEYLLQYCRDLRDPELDEVVKISYEDAITDSIRIMAKNGLRNEGIIQRIKDYLGDEGVSEVGDVLLQRLVRKGVNEHINAAFRAG